MRKAVLFAVLVAAAAFLTTGLAFAHHSPPDGPEDASPEFIAGNVSNDCDGGQKLDGSSDGGPTGDIDSGNYTLFFPNLGPDGSTMHLQIIVDSAAKTFTFISSTGEVVTSIYVKGGPDGSLLYDYGAAGVEHDDGLHSPVNSKNGKYYGLSHICIFADKITAR